MTHILKDTLWKGIIEDLFDDFLYYFFPEWTVKTVDFSKPFEFLDKELDEIYPKPQNNQKRYADKLVKVFTNTGEEQWLLIHIEVQGYKDQEFAERMFIYFTRIKERFKKDIMTLAILTDDYKAFHPKAYKYQYQDTKLVYQFATFKLLEKTEQELELVNNPFSVVMLAARKALIKSNLEDAKQLIWKMDLVRNLQKANYDNDKIRKILNFIRYYVRFENIKELETLNQQIQIAFKQRKNMGIEEAILQEVREQGEQTGIQQGLQQGELQTKIKGIKNLLLKGKLSLQEIAEVFEVSIEFVQKVQKGEIQ